MKIDELQPQSTPNIKGFRLSVDLLLFNKVTDHIKESKQPFCGFNNVTVFGKDSLYRHLSWWVKMSVWTSWGKCPRDSFRRTKESEKRIGGVERIEAEEDLRALEGVLVSRSQSVS